MGSRFETVMDLPRESEPGAPPDAILIDKIRWELGWLVGASLENASRRRSAVPLFWQSCGYIEKASWYH